MKTGGVENHGGKIRVSYTWRGKRTRKTLGLAYTPANVKHATRMVHEIRQRIRFGTFNPGDYFPGEGVSSATTFGTLAATWAKTLADLAPSTRKAYTSALNAHWLTDAVGFKDRPIAAILASDVKVAIAGRAFATNKTRNNALIALRAVFAIAMGDGVITKDPTAGIENLPHQAPEPDPLSREEAAAIVARLRRMYGDEAADYFDFAFYTGMRCPSELIELRWTDVDLRAGTLRISRAKVLQQVKGTKTHAERTVTLNDAARAILERQRARTQLASGTVFRNPSTGLPYLDDQIPRRRWTAALKAEGLRHRDAYQTRHSYATWAIMVGANSAWLAKQLGHSVEVLHRRYARWIEDAEAGRREMDRINAAFAVSEQGRKAQ